MSTKFQPGTSGNAAGRPKLGTSLAERVRRLVDPDELVNFLIGVCYGRMASGVKISDRLAAAQMLADRGWGKPLTTVDLQATLGASSAALPERWESLSPAERRAHLIGLVPTLALAASNEDKS